ncbi:MAG TPA: DUF3568 family protein [Myxococcota bacterium]|nr:DUF3568 family protein [Myxococcota bacterium]
MPRSSFQPGRAAPRRTGHPLRARAASGIFALSAALLLGGQTGCLLLAAGAGAGAGATWYLSAARDQVSQDPRAVVAAAASVLREMDIAVEKRAATALDGEVIGRTARGERVEVHATSSTAGTTEIIVRVGLIDDDAAQRILGRIVARL